MPENEHIFSSIVGAKKYITRRLRRLPTNGTTEQVRLETCKEIKMAIDYIYEQYKEIEEELNNYDEDVDEEDK